MTSVAPPSRVGPYEIISRLGAGGMAETYVAVRRGPGGFAQRVCLKRLRPELERDPEFVRQLMAEAAIAARLRHAAIAQVLDFGRDGHDYYLALELVDGCDLRELLSAHGGALPHGLVLYVAIELATALDFAHRAGGSGTGGAVVHRDVSPSNTLMSSEGEVKLTDFGIARSVGAVHHTRTGIVKGKVPYMAPEYARNGLLDPRSDLFSLGVLLYECLAGARPHDGATDLETLERASRGQRVPLAQRAEHAPSGLIEIVECLLEPAPELRQKSAGDLLEALLALPAPARARLEIGARVGAVVRERGARRETAAAAEPQPATEIMPIADTSVETAAPSAPVMTRAGRRSSSPARGEASAASSSLEVPRLRARRGPLLALAFALLLALAVSGFALVRARESGTRGDAATALPPRVAAAQSGAAAPTRAAPPTRALTDTAQPIVVRSGPAGAETGAASAAQPGLSALTGDAAQRAWIEVVVLPYGQVSIDGKPAGNAPVTVMVAPGEHTIEARSRGNTHVRRVSVEAEQRKRVVVR